MILLKHNKDQRKLDYKVVNFYVALNELCYEYNIPQMNLNLFFKKFKVYFSLNFINIITDYDGHKLTK